MLSPLVQWRKNLGLTQNELSILAGVSSSKISEIENGISPLDGLLSDFLRRTGEEAVKVVDQHESFREYRKKELLRKVDLDPAI